MKNKILLIALMLFSAFASGAAEPVRFTASAPSTVIVDKPFQLVYTVNATGKDLKVPEFTNFEVLAGPFESRSFEYRLCSLSSYSEIYYCQ